MQLLHSALPGAALNAPAAHAEHAPPSCPVKPASHKQAVCCVLAGGLEEFGRQLLHAALPVEALYSPAAHAAHSPPSDPMYPALQRQSASAVLPAGEAENAGHAVARSRAPAQ